VGRGKGGRRRAKLLGRPNDKRLHRASPGQCSPHSAGTCAHKCVHKGSRVVLGRTGGGKTHLPSYRLRGAGHTWAVQCV
jgi:hypothetical protein